MLRREQTSPGPTKCGMPQKTLAAPIFTPLVRKASVTARPATNGGSCAKTRWVTRILQSELVKVPFCSTGHDFRTQDRLTLLLVRAASVQT